MASPPGSSSLFDTEADAPPAKKKLTAAKFKLHNRAFTDKKLSASAHRVLAYAIEKAGDDGRFWKKYSTIAREVGIDRSTAIRAMNTLTDRGYIERKGRYNGAGNSANVYRLALDLGGAMRATIREGRRRGKGRGANKDERAKAAIVRGLALKIPGPPWRGDDQGEQAANSTEKPPLRSRNPATLEVATSPPQESQPCDPYNTLPVNPSLEPLRIASLEGEKQVVQQGNGEGIEDGASIGKNVASVTIPPGKPSPPLHDTFDPSTSSPDEPLSSTLTVNRPIPGAEGPDHAQRSLGPMLVITGGLEKKAAEVDANTPAVAALEPLVVAKKSAIDAIGKRKFLERDLLLNHRLGAVPVKFQDGVRALEYLEWANELVGAATPAASGGAA